MCEHAYYVDLRADTVGRFVGYDGPGSVLLHPIGGGREWAVPVKHAKAADTVEVIRAKLAVENARSAR